MHTYAHTPDALAEFLLQSREILQLNGKLRLHGIYFLCHVSTYSVGAEVLWQCGVMMVWNGSVWYCMYVCMYVCTSLSALILSVYVSTFFCCCSLTLHTDNEGRINFEQVTQWHNDMRAPALSQFAEHKRTVLYKYCISLPPKISVDKPTNRLLNALSCCEAYAELDTVRCGETLCGAVCCVVA